VNEEADEARVNALAEDFHRSGYDIQKLMISIFNTDWFYDQKNIGTRIKSPVEWLVGIRRQLPQDIENPEVQILIQRLLGQVLFNPPNVAGWPGGKHWINSSSLMLRMHIPEIIYTSDAIRAKPKDDDDLMMGMKDNTAGLQRPSDRKKRNAGQGNMERAGQFIRTRINWPLFTGHFQNTDDGDLFAGIRKLLLQTGTAIPDADLRKYLDPSDRNSLIQSAAIRYMSLPEYQLC
jgi:hypothetical protein